MPVLVTSPVVSKKATKVAPAATAVKVTKVVPALADILTGTGTGREILNR